MKVLTMQLNSVTLMDLMAYGGAGLGIISAASAFAKGQLSLTSALTILLLAADFFLVPAYYVIMKKYRAPRAYGLKKLLLRVKPKKAA